MSHTLASNRFQIAVYLAEDGRARKSNVEVAGIGTQNASIKSGVHEGQDGARIRIDGAVK